MYGSSSGSDFERKLQRSDVYHAIKHVTRRKLLDTIIEHGGTEGLTHKEIEDYFDISGSMVNQHLKVLMNANLVVAYKRGNSTIYTVTPEPLKEVAEFVSKYLVKKDGA